MLDNNIKTQLKAYFEKIVSPITLTASLDDSQASAQMRELLNEVAEQSNKITVETNGNDKHLDRKSTRLNSSHIPLSRMPSSA